MSDLVSLLKQMSFPAININGSSVAVPAQATCLKDPVDQGWYVFWKQFDYRSFYNCNQER